MKRAKRSAQRVKDGPEILAVVRSEEARDAMIEAARNDIPSVSGISPILLDRFDDDVVMNVPTRALIGLCVRAVMAEEGYDIAERGVRTDPAQDKVFTTGTVYEKVEVEPEEEVETEFEDDAAIVDLVVAVCTKKLGELSRRRVIAELEESLAA